jgi:hypothetical protein
LFDDDGITPYYSPSFIPTSSSQRASEEETWLIHSRWSNQHFTTFEIVHVESSSVWSVEGVGKGRYLSPVVSSSAKGGKRRIAFVKTGGDWLTGNVEATAGVGLWIGEIALPSPSSAIQSSGRGKVPVENLTFVPSEVEEGDRVVLHWVPGDDAWSDGSMLVVEQSQRVFTIDLSTEGKKDVAGKPQHRTLLRGKMSTEVSGSPSFLASLFSSSSSSGNNRRNKRKDQSQGYVAFKDFMQLYIAPISTHLVGDDGEEVWSKPGNSTKGLGRVSKDGGHDLAWSGSRSSGNLKEGEERIWWMLGWYFLCLYLHN